MRRWVYLLLTLITLVLLAAAAAAWFGPDLLRDRAQAWLREETGRSLTVGQVRINLLALSVEINDVVLTEPDLHTPFVTWQRLSLALSPRSLWHRAPVVRELHLEQPTLRIERLPAGRYNFSDLLDRPGAKAAPADASEQTGFSLNNLTVTGGHIEMLDRTLPSPVTHRVEGLDLAVPFVGNLPYLADRYVQPLLRATVNGTPFELKGELKPFADVQEYSLKLKFTGLELPDYLVYLPVSLPVSIVRGRLDLDVDLSIRASASVKPVLEMAGRIDLTTLDLREPGGRPLLFVPLLEARLAPSRLLEQKIHLSSLAINNPQSWLERDQDGMWNVAGLGHGTAAASQRPPTDDAAPLALQIDQLQLRRGRLELRDRLPAGGFTTVLTAIDVTAEGFTLAPHTPFQVALGLSSERQERLGISGKITANPFALDLAVEAKGLPLAAYRPYYQAQTTAVIGGELQGSARLQLSPERPLLLGDLQLALHALDLPLANAEGFRLDSATLQGGRYDLAANHLEIADLSFAGADLRFSRDREGRWSFLDRNYPLLAKLAEPVSQAAPTAAEGHPFSWRIGRIALTEARIAFLDRQPAEPVSFNLTDLAITVNGLAAPEQALGSFSLQGTVQNRGEFQARGSVVAGRPEISAAVQLRRIPLTTFAPYVAERARVVVVDGALDSQLNLSLTNTGNHWQGRVSGDLGVSRFYCLDATHREDLLRWERLQASGIDARLDPPALRIAALTLNDYYARVLLDEQARLNFAELAVQSPAAEAEAQLVSTPPPATPAPPPPAPPKPEINISKITLQGGKVNFTDRHMPRPFSVEMLKLGGRIEGLSSSAGSRAEIDLRGRLRNESPVTIAGTVNPLADPLFLDLKLDFNDIELSPLSPYSGTYIGYLIEHGKMNVNLSYLVENGRLTASNKLFLDQFTFGDPVESDKATNLPVRLAVALLKDRNGEIHLDIPVSGDINDPQFSVWRVVWQIIKNLLVKAATSPMALLGVIAGGDEDLSAISFPYGSASLTEPEQAKLAKIAEVLRDRPDLKLEVKGFVDPENDPEEYRRELLQERIRREKFLDLRKREGDAAPADAEAVTVTGEEYPEYLWRVYKQADFSKPRNLIGMVKHLPDPELEKLLLANTKVGTEELTALAQARAQTVVAALVETGSIPHERIFLSTTEITAKPAVEGVSRSRVEFGMALK